MHTSLLLIRLLFLSLCTVFSITYVMGSYTTYTPMQLTLGASVGLAFGIVVIAFEAIFKMTNLKSFNIALIGLFLGYLMSQTIILILESVLTHGGHPLPASIPFIEGSITLLSCYFGMVMIAKSSEDLHACIPFIKLNRNNQKMKNLLADSSLLVDPRVIDLATSGLLDHRLIIPRFIVKELQALVDHPDEAVRTRARRSLDTVKKLESIPTLDLQYTDNDYPDIKDSNAKLVRLATVLDVNIFTADTSRSQQAISDGIRFINIHALSCALKPLAQTGEYINIKIQRYGKEPRQGVGYLDDGTMVVVNSAAEFIGDIIRAQVLSVKHTASGRMIFCNAAEGDLCEMSPALSGSCTDPNESTLAKNYFAL